MLDVVLAVGAVAGDWVGGADGLVGVDGAGGKRLARRVERG